MNYSYAAKKNLLNRKAGTKAPEGREAGAETRMTDSALRTADAPGRRIDLPEAIRAKMENAFGTDLSAVELYESQKVADGGAEAVAQGNRIAFAPGVASFSTRRGQTVLGHELSHVMSQARGEVTGSGFLDNSRLEARADREGAMAAAGEQVYTGPVTSALSEAAPGAATAGPMQALRDKSEAAKKADKGDFSGYAKMSSEEKAPLVAKKRSDIMDALRDRSDLKTTFGRTTTQMLDPVTRQTMSEMSRDPSLSDDHRGKLGKAMEDMDQDMLVRTMMPIGEQQEHNLRVFYNRKDDMKRLQREYKESAFKWKLGEETMTSEEVDAMLNGPARTDREVSRLVREDKQTAQKSGDAMLKLMLLMQMGNFTKTEKGANGEKTSKKWDKTMANAFSHGARTGFVFGETEDKNGREYSTDTIFRSVFGTPDAMGSPIKSRAAATHRLVTPKVGQSMKEGYEEQKGMLAAAMGKIDSGFHNYGMNMAIGGAGNGGVAGEDKVPQMINADGRSGHMYVGSRDSTETTRGGMLVGLESDSPYRMNQTGHMHTARAVSELDSSTGGMKADIVGEKYGGRTVDFNGAKNSDIVAVMGAFDRRLEAMRRDTSDAGRRRYEAMLRKISGERMTDKEMNSLMMRLLPGDENKEVRKRLRTARRGVDAAHA